MRSPFDKRSRGADRSIDRKSVGKSVGEKNKRGRGSYDVGHSFPRTTKRASFSADRDTPCALLSIPRVVIYSSPLLAFISPLALLLLFYFALSSLFFPLYHFLHSLCRSPLKNRRPEICYPVFLSSPLLDHLLAFVSRRRNRGEAKHLRRSKGKFVRSKGDE